MKILSWNIYMLPHCVWIKKNYKRAIAIANVLSESDYDIIVFEEAFDFWARRVLRKLLQNLYPFMYGPANMSFLSVRTNSGIWVLSKIPLKKLKEIEYKISSGFDSMARKGAVIFEGEWNKQPFQLIGTHLQADSPHKIRHAQCHNIISEILRPFSKENVPQFICGDFNIEKDDHENYQYMLKVLEAENGILHGDIFVSYDEIDNHLAKKKNGKKSLIDYVLVRNTKLIKSIQRRISIFRLYRNSIHFELSDHYGIEAVIKFESSYPFRAKAR